MASKLVATLLHANLIHTTTGQRIEAYVIEKSCSVTHALVMLGIFESHILCSHISHTLGITIFDLKEYRYPAIQLAEETLKQCLALGALPIDSQEHSVSFAVDDPTDTDLLSKLQFFIGQEIELFVASHTELQNAIAHIYQQLDTSKAITCLEKNKLTFDESATRYSSQKDEGTSPLLVNNSNAALQAIIQEAVQRQVSDIHFEPYENAYRVRFRCDGVLTETKPTTTPLSERLSAQIKILANLDISEKRLPQDGRFSMALSGHPPIDIRVSTLPTIWGEKTVLRLLESHSIALSIDRLGMSPTQQTLYQTGLHKPQGLILITGPTGSGKTMTLYSGLSLLNSLERNISTVEDPVEIVLEGVNQVQLNEKIGLNFVSALKALLRQDPDVLMIGEIRDKESAEIAIKAAQTGHLVLSTLHTNSACSTISRLLHMGINQHLLASSLSLVIAQRLVRRLCPCCKIAVNSPKVDNANPLPNTPTTYQANKEGCERCNRGYLGRVGIYETLSIDEKIQACIEGGFSTTAIESEAQRGDFVPLNRIGESAFYQGITSREELRRVLCFGDR